VMLGKIINWLTFLSCYLLFHSYRGMDGLPGSPGPNGLPGSGGVRGYRVKIKLI
jgi:hypothetical protein